MYGLPSRLKRMRSIVFGIRRGAHGGARVGAHAFLIDDDGGRQSFEHVDVRLVVVGMNPCTKALYVSLISRCDSAAIVPNTNELLPEPETPVNTVSRRLGRSTLTSFRLFTRGPVHADQVMLVGDVRSCRRRSLRRGHGHRQACAMRTMLPEGSRKRAVSCAPGLRDRLLEHVGARRRDLLRTWRRDRRPGRSPPAGTPVSPGSAACRPRPARVRREAGTGRLVDVLGRTADGDPPEAVGRDVVADLEPEGHPGRSPVRRRDRGRG